MSSSIARNAPDAVASSDHGGEQHPRARRNAAWVVALALLGLAVCVAIGLGLRDAQARSDRAELRIETRQRVELLRDEAVRSLEVLRSVASFVRVRGSAPTRAEFREFVSGPLSRLHELQALEWIPRVPVGERAAYEARAHADGLTSFRFTELDAQAVPRAASVRPLYFPVYYCEPQALNARALGLDLYADEARRSALDEAARSGRPTASAPVRLAQEHERGALGFLVVQAVGAPSALRGFALAVFRVADLMKPLLARFESQALGLRLVDVRSGTLLVGTSRASADLERAHSETLRLGERPFEMTVYRLSPSRVWRDHPAIMLYPLAGVLLVALIATYVLLGIRHTERVEQRVHARTQELRLAEHKYRSIFENSLAGIFQTTADGRYLDVNAALVALYGYDSREELITSFNDIGLQLYVDRARRGQFVELMRRAGAVSDFVSEVRKRDGERIWISESAVSVRAADGALLYYQGSVQDVSERVRAETDKRRQNALLEQRVGERTAALAEANERLSAEIEVRKRAEHEAASARAEQARFLAVMSHEIRTPLNAMIGYAQVLAPQIEPRDQLSREALTTISQSGYQLLSLVDEVLDLSKIEAGRLTLHAEDFHLRALLDNLSAVFRPRCHERALALHVEARAEELGWVRGDLGKLRQVLTNLLGNAVKYTERGSVCLRVAREPEMRFRFEVRDTGRGIALAEQARVFGDFYQADAAATASGVGLGLSIARRLVEWMGGELALQSTAQVGSIFSFTLSFAAALSSNAQPGPTMPRLAAGSRCRALVVDDSAENRRVVSLLLERLGAQTESVSDGEGALERCAAETFDVIFLDLLLPGLDGAETARQLRSRALTTAALVAYSASALDAQRAQAFDAFVAKPVRMERLIEVLARLPGLRFERGDACEDERPAPLVIEDRTLTPLLEQIASFASQYRVTRLREAFSELAAAGAEGARLYARFDPLLARYDMLGLAQMIASLLPASHDEPRRC